MMWGWQAGMGWWMIFGVIIMLIFWGGIITLIVWGIRRISGGDRERRIGSRDALDIIKERYARGEITKEQYEQYKKDLQ
jgi:putative membrane protein